IEGRQHLAQRRLVEPDARLAFAALDVEVDAEVAAHDALADRLADARLPRLVPGRQPQSHIEAATVDGAHLPMPADRAYCAVGPGKAGHALDGHVSASSMPLVLSPFHQQRFDPGSEAPANCSRRAIEEQGRATGDAGLSRSAFGRGG